VVDKTLIQQKSDYEIRQTLESMGIREEDLYDYSATQEDLYKIPVNDGLSDAERQDAEVWKRFYYGVMMVTGRTGSGKGVFTINLMYKMKRYFGRKIMLDYKPRELFGPYVPVTEETMMGELTKMNEVAQVKRVEEGSRKKLKHVEEMKKEELQALASTWMSSKGSVFMQGAAVGLDELKRYFHNRRPHNPNGVMWGHVLTVHRHLDMLFVGMTPYEREIDEISFMPYVTHRVLCSQRYDGKIQADVYQTVWIGAKGVLEAKGKPFRMVIDPIKPRPELGGKRIVDLYNSKDPKVMKVSGVQRKSYENE